MLSIVGFLAMIIALSTHEFSHALAAYLLGDETAKRMGRLTLNPLAHADPIGTLLIPLLGAMSGLPLIGWAKPVPFNAYNLKYPKWGSTIVALAGPGSNFVFAFIYLALLRLCLEFWHLPFTNLLVLFLLTLVMINVALGIFNFIPVPPLDGSKLLEALLTHPKHRQILYTLETKGPMFLLLFIVIDSFSPRPILGSLIRAAINAVFSLAGLGYLGSIF
ncbi:site-2 protease family protein [Candidatus Uhrbacteria bacterium]|nr:site-2 protease family protein [Candidatus Uhrbacteria bacterium]